MNAIDLLTRQHRVLEDHMDALMDVDKACAQAALLVQLEHDLHLHVAAVEQVFSVAMKASSAPEGLREKINGHLVQRRRLAGLLTLSPIDSAFEIEFEMWRDQVEQLHCEEEARLFPQLRRLLGEPQLEALGCQMVEMQGPLHDPQHASRRDAVRDTENAAEI